MSEILNLPSADQLINWQKHIENWREKRKFLIPGTIKDEPINGGRPKSPRSYLPDKGYGDYLLSDFIVEDTGEQVNVCLYFTCYGMHGDVIDDFFQRIPFDEFIKQENE